MVSETKFRSILKIGRNSFSPFVQLSHLLESHLDMDTIVRSDLAPNLADFLAAGG